MEDIIHLAVEKDVVRYIVLKKFEVRVTEQMCNIRRVSGNHAASLEVQ